jgi:hypothetical protein
MRTSSYLEALQEAKAELIGAIKERDRLNFEILRLQQLVKALTQHTEKSESDLTLDTGEAMGFTDAVLTNSANTQIHSALSTRCSEDWNRKGEFGRLLPVVMSSVVRCIRRFWRLRTPPSTTTAIPT